MCIQLTIHKAGYTDTVQEDQSWTAFVGWISDSAKF